MTIPSSWREAYSNQKDEATILRREVDRLLTKVPSGWYSESRIKQEDSFYQKIETGRVQDFSRLEDFFGAVIVVPLPADIKEALLFVESFFQIEYRRPERSDVASHAPDVFRFNDIRLYGKLIPSDVLPPRPLDSIVFEIQVRTFFQHAWSSATHDLIYKYERFSWARSRVAAQIKAVLENAELSISALDQLEANPLLPVDGLPESTLNGFLEVINSNWDSAVLPSNRKRLAETISSLCSVLRLDVAAFDDMLRLGSSEIGGHPDGWSPYQCLVEYMSRQKPVELLKVLRKEPARSGSGSMVVHVTSEVLDRLGVSIAQCPRARL